VDSGEDNTKTQQVAVPEGSVVLSPTEQEELQRYLNEAESTSRGGEAYPTGPSKDSIFKFFREILERADSSKAANVDKYELGYLPLPVRAYQSIAHYCEMRGLGLWQRWAMGKGEIILATSLSKKGFLPQLFVTQIKREQKGPSSRVVEKGFFGKKKVIDDGGEQGES